MYAPLLDRRGPVEAEVVVAADLEVDLHDVEDHRELREEHESLESHFGGELY